MRPTDVALVAKKRIPAAGIPDGFGEGAPDLAIEVLSPTDRMGDVLEKVRDYLEAGAQQVWVVDPKSHTVTLYKSLQDVRVLTEKDILEGEGVVDDFECDVGVLFSY